MKIDVVSWQLDRSYAWTERRADGSAVEHPHPLGLTNDDSSLPIASISHKTNDGLAWMGNFDRHPSRISDIASLRNLIAIYKAQDIGFYPWMVVQLRAPGQNIAQLEGTLAGQIAATAGGTMVVDLEPHEVGANGSVYYLRDDLGANGDDVRTFMRAFLAVPGAREVHINPDARPGRMPTFADWWAIDEVTTVRPQVYWTDFGLSYGSALRSAIATLQGAGVQQLSNVRMMLPVNGTPTDVVAAIQYSHELGCSRPSLYQRGTASPAVFAAIDAMADPWAAAALVPAPTPQPPAFVPAALAEVALMRATIDRLELILKGG